MKYILFFILILISSCTNINVEQKVFEDGLSEINIQISKTDSPINYCNKFEEQTILFDSNCIENNNELKISGKYYLNSQDFNFEKKFLKTNIKYDLKSIYPILNEIALLENPQYAIFYDENLKENEFSKNIKLNLEFENKIIDSPFKFEENIITTNFQEISNKRRTQIETSNLNILNIIILFSVIVIFILSIILYLKIKKPNNNMFLAEEEKCKTYIINFKNQYSKEVLFQGLINSGIDQNRAKYYIQKYF